MPRARRPVSTTSVVPLAPPGAASISSEGDAVPSNEEVLMPGISFHILKQYQYLFMMLASAEVRQCGSAGVLSVAEQGTRLLESYQRLVNLWFRGDATLMRTRNMPACPRALIALGSEAAALRAMLATTSRAARAHTGISIRDKCRQIKTEMLNLIALWNVACKGSANSSSILQPGTGQTEVSIYARLVAIAWRVAETQRVMKLRVAWFGIDSSHSEYCTIERIREAYTSHYYATRGFTIQEQQQDIASFNSNGRRARHTILRRIQELVDADFELNGQPAAAAIAPAEQQLRSSFQEVDYNCSSSSCFSSSYHHHHIIIKLLIFFHAQHIGSNALELGHRRVLGVQSARSVQWCIDFILVSRME